MPNLYNLVVKDLDGNDVTLEQYRGQVLLIVNTASECGYAKQNKGLQDLYEKYHDDGFTVLAFPSHDFEQESKTEDELREYFVDENVTFPVFGKVHVLEDNRSPLFQYLVEAEPKEWLDTPEDDKSYEFQKEFHDGYWGKEITWNYNKFLIDRDGKLIGRYASFVTPGELEERIEVLLDPSKREETREKTLEDGVFPHHRDVAREDEDVLEPPIIVPPVGTDPSNPSTPPGPLV